MMAGLLPDYYRGESETAGGGLLPWLDSTVAAPRQGGAQRLQEQAQPPPPAASFGDRLGAGVMGFLNSAAPFPAIGNLIGGLATGQRTDPGGVVQRLREQAQPPPPAASFGDRLGAGVMGFLNSEALFPAIGNLIGGVTTGQRTDPGGIAQRLREQAQRAASDYVAGAQDIDPNLEAAMAANPALAAQYLSARARVGPRSGAASTPGYNWADVKGTSKGSQAMPHSASKTRVNALESGGSIIGKPGETIIGHGEWQTLPNGARIRQVK